MKKIFAPWRKEYVNSKARTKNENTKKNECTFCLQFKKDSDEKYFILKRMGNWVILLNRYPYNAGHILIMPIKHIADLQDLSVADRSQLMELTNQTINIINSALQPEGFNVGFNLGKAAGAGVPSHLHMHIVPRWGGDTNFMPVLGQTRIISFDLEDIYQRLKPHFKSLESL